jgi:hypothetical protein
MRISTLLAFLLVALLAVASLADAKKGAPPPESRALSPRAPAATSSSPTL